MFVGCATTTGYEKNRRAHLKKDYYHEVTRGKSGPLFLSTNNTPTREKRVVLKTKLTEEVVPRIADRI